MKKFLTVFFYYFHFITKLMKFKTSFKLFVVIRNFNHMGTFQSKNTQACNE